MRIMTSLLIRVVINAAAIWVATRVVQGVTVEAATTSRMIVTFLLVGLIFGLVNAFIRPVVKLFALPLYVLTLGLITFVINAAMLMLTSWISQRASLTFQVDDFFFSALLGALVVSVVSWILSLVLD
jgi:putative membrane protein